MLRRFVAPLLWGGFLIGVILIVAERGLPDLPGSPVFGPPADSRAAFDSWLEEQPGRRVEFGEFETFLAGEGVGEVVPAWQLMRVDARYATQCDIPPFGIPPRELWPNIVPALALVRDRVEPTIGPVEVRSSWRTPELNACARGAAASKHLQFAALDLVTRDRQRGENLYRRLCAIHAEAGPPSRMGLGAYFDPAEPRFGGGRFHIDATGYRSWGRGYTRASSPCRSFN